MDLPLDTRNVISVMSSNALSYTYLAAYHTILSWVLATFFSPASSETRLQIIYARSIHIGLFCRMRGTSEWVRSAWVLMTRDEPPEWSPSEEVVGVLGNGLLLVLYIIDSLFFTYAGVIISAIWTHLILLSCLGVGIVVLLPLSATLAARLGEKETAKMYEHESHFTRSVLFLVAIVSRVGISIYKVASNARQIPKNVNGYLLEVSRPRPGTYRQKFPDDIYQYESLDAPSQEIRLLKLTRNPLTGINCSLKRFSLQEAPPYEAISYIWGSSTKDYLIFLDGHWLPITGNAYKIFRDRASYLRTRWLWIDAVCLNQEDDAEKSIQVGMMGQIYQCADRVLVWLGDMVARSFEVMLAMHLLERLNSVIRNYEEYKLKVDAIEVIAGDSQSWEALATLLTHPYWQRMWVVQEIAKARKLHILYGGWYISWDRFSRLVSQLVIDPGNRIIGQELYLFTKDIVSVIGGITQVNVISAIREPLTRGELLTLEGTLAFTSQSKATDPRDKIFALGNLIRLAGIEKHTDIKPNYSLTVHEVYTRTARYLLSGNSSFGFLQSGIGHPRNIPNLPSWVQDWTITNPNSYLRQVESNETWAYQASGTSELMPCIFTHSTDFPEISLRAIAISKIEHMSAIPYNFPGRKVDLKQLKAFYEAAHSTAFLHLPTTYKLTNQSLTEAFWRSLICDRHPNTEHGIQRPAQREWGEYFQIWRNEILGVEGPARIQMNAEAARLRNASLSYGRGVANSCSDYRRFAITENGMITLVPLLTEVGDVVCLVAGAAKPVLLRPEKEGKRRYQMVGDCYVHGVMDGELWDGGKTARMFPIY